MRENLNILFSAPHLPCVIDLEYSWKNEETPEIEEGGAVESLGLSSEIDQSWDTYATEIASSLGPQGYFEPWLVNLRGGANDENEITEMDEISIRALSYPYVVLNLARIANSFKQNASRWQPPVD